MNIKNKKLGFTDEIDGELDREFTSNADGDKVDVDNDTIISLKKDEYIGKTSAFTEGRDTTASIMRNSVVRTGADEYSNAEGYGLFCGKKCAQAKRDAGIPPKGALKAQEKQSEAQLNLALAQGLSQAPVIPVQSGMGTGTIALMVFGGLAIVGGLAYMFFKGKKKAA